MYCQTANMIYDELEDSQCNAPVSIIGDEGTDRRAHYAHQSEPFREPLESEPC